MASSYANVQNAWLFRDMDVEAEFSRTLRERHDDQTKAIALARFGPEGDLLSRLRGNESTTKDDALSVKAREVAAQRKPGEHDWFTRPAGQSKSLAGYSFDINCPALKKAAGAVVIGADAFTWNERDQLPSPDEIKRRNRERSAALRMQAMKQKPLEDALDWKTKGVLQFGSPDGPCEEPGTNFSGKRKRKSAKTSESNRPSDSWSSASTPTSVVKTKINLMRMKLKSQAL